MKKIILATILLFSITAGYSEDKSLLQKAADKTVEVIDSTKAAVKETVSVIDTSSNFKRIYGDVKSGIQGLAQGLKVGAVHVYEVLVKQQIVNSIVWILIGLLPMIIFIVFGKSMWKWADRNNNESDGFSWAITIIFYMMTIIPSIVVMFHMTTIVTGFVNPEYGAIQEILNFVSDKTTK